MCVSEYYSTLLMNMSKLHVCLSVALYFVIAEVCGNQLNISSQIFTSSHFLYEGYVKYTPNNCKHFLWLPVCLIHLTLRSLSVGRKAHLMRIVIDYKSCPPRSCPSTFVLTFKEVNQLTTNMQV